jgi:IS30 family transposase
MKEKMQKPNSGVQKRGSASQFKIEERRRKVADLLAEGYNETEIAKELGVSVSSISREVAVLKEKSQQFVYDLAKSDLAFYYQGRINGVNAVKRKAWELLRSKHDSLTTGEHLAILKLIKECEQAQFSMLQAGPSAMALNALHEDVEQIKEETEEKQTDDVSRQATGAAQA